MGKATITGGGTDGEYTALVRFRRDTIEAQIAELEIRADKYRDKIDSLEEGREKNMLKAQLLGIEKRVAYLGTAAPADKPISVWCADLTEDLSGDVGLVEVPGQTQAFNIVPGFDGEAGYNISTHGFIMPTVGLTAAQAYANLGLLPAWQKWKPTFRYGEITALEDDMCSVDLEAATSTQQALNVNQGTTLSDVPIVYMDCNGEAFEEGDAVLIKFNGQDFGSPEVVGFKEHPKPCGYDFFIKPVFNGHEPIQGNQTIKISLIIEGDLIEAEGVVYGVRNEPPDPALDGLVDFRGAGVPGKIADPTVETSAFVKSHGRMDLIGLETDPEFIANLGYMEDFTFLHYSVSDSSDYTIKYKGVYLKEVEYRVGDYPIAEGAQSTVTVEGVEYDVYEMDFSNLSTLKQTPNSAALDNANAWVKSMQHSENGPGVYGPWLDNRYSNIYYYPNAWQKAYDYGIDPRVEFQDRVLDDWLYGYCVLERGWWAQLRELNLAVSDSLGGGGDIGNIPVTSFVIISDPDGGNPTFENYNVTRSAGTYRLYYLQDCVNEGQPAYPAVEGEDYSPYSYTWAYSIVETPPELW